MEKCIITGSGIYLICTKTTCFGRMKAYEGKNFAFMFASY